MNSEHSKKLVLRKPNIFVWIFWWQMDHNELDRQVKEYDTLKFLQTARGLSSIFLLIAVAAQIIIVSFYGFPPIIFIDSAVLVALAYCVTKGYRFAFIAAMVLWTIEKGITLTFCGAAFVVPMIIWWTVYLHAFYLGWKVEGVRRSK